MTSRAARFALFDLDGTLVDSTTPMRDWAQHLCTRYELPAESAELIMKNRDACSTWQEFAGTAARHLGRADSAAEWTADLLANFVRGSIVDALDLILASA